MPFATSKRATYFSAYLEKMVNDHVIMRFRGLKTKTIVLKRLKGSEGYREQLRLDYTTSERVNKAIEIKSTDNE